MADYIYVNPSCGCPSLLPSSLRKQGTHTSRRCDYWAVVETFVDNNVLRLWVP